MKIIMARMCSLFVHIIFIYTKVNTKSCNWRRNATYTTLNPDNHIFPFCKNDSIEYLKNVKFSINGVKRHILRVSDPCNPKRRLLKMSSQTQHTGHQVKLIYTSALSGFLFVCFLL